MKQCISRIRTALIHLWQTLKKYVCRKDLDNDGKKEIIIAPSGKAESILSEGNHDVVIKEEL